MAEATQRLTPTWPDPTAVVDLIDDLRAAGYNLDLTHYMAAPDLLLALAARGETLDQPERLKGLLGPLLCCSPAEQAEFPHHFDRWIVRLPHPADPIPVAMPTGALEAELVAIDRQVRWGRRLLMGIYILLLSSVLQTTHPPMLGVAPTPTPISVANNTPATPLPEQIAPVTPPPSLLDRMGRWLWRWQTLAVILVLLMPWLAWRLWWFYQAHLFLARHATTQTPALEQIIVQSSATTLFAPLALFRLAQGLRRRVEIPSYELDIEGALNATIQQAGWFTPVYGRRRVVPEYLILVDRAHYHDHQARLVEELVQRLRAYEVLITLYAFDGDPRICFPLVGKGAPLTLRDLTTRHPDQRLILFADAQSLFSPFTGALEPWVAQLARWPQRALLTPEVAINWGYREQELAEHFSVLPATPAGLAQLVHSFTQPALFTDANDIPQARLPDALRTRPLRWLERQPPEPAVVETLLADLRTYLDGTGFTWLCACAVYPTIDWNLTLYLGHALQTDERAQNSDSTITSQSFTYGITANDDASSQPISSAEVRIEVTGQAPLTEYTDNNGYARIFISAAMAEQPARLTVAADNYMTATYNIDLWPDRLPDEVRLTLSGLPLAAATLSSAPAGATASPVVLATNTPLANPRPTAATFATPAPGGGSAPFVLFSGDPRANNPLLCRGFRSDCNFVSCGNTTKLLYGPACLEGEDARIVPGLYEVMLEGNGMVLAGRMPEGIDTFHVPIDAYSLTLPSTYTFCWAGWQSSTQSFGILVLNMIELPNSVQHVEIRYLRPGC